MKTLDEQINAVALRLESHRSALGEGNLDIDVKSLQPEMEAMLKHMHTLTPAEGQAYLPQLEQLVRGITELTADYQRLQSALSSEAKRVNNLAQAHTAYAKSGAIPGKRTEEES